MDEADDALIGDENEPRDAIPEEFRNPLAAEDAEQLPSRGSGLGFRVLAYGAAAAWPFLGAYYEYKTLNDSGAYSNLCDESGCVPLGNEFAHQALGWLLPLSIASMLVVWGTQAALRALRVRRRMREPKDKPVNRFVLAGMFVGICALALLVGVLRGVMIDRYGR
jgi:hypothetical protein